jgi:hypothetical protein
MRLIFMSEFKDPSAIHVDDPDRFTERWADLVAAAVPWPEIEQAEALTRLMQARAELGELESATDLLGVFVASLRDDGLVGEERAVKLVYLCATSRLLAQPVSALMRGPSSAGKSFIVNTILQRYFPPEAYHLLTAMSDRALIYSDVDLKHRVLVMHETAGLGELAEYFVRSYQSEGHLRYETVEATAEGIKPRVVEKEGPVCLMLTTTAVTMNQENLNRLFAIPVTDTPEQTKAIFRAQAREDEPPVEKYLPWQALQTLLAGEEHVVTVPYRHALAELTRPAGVRMRRDFKALLNLIRAHALLHSLHRERDDASRIVASLDDYVVVHDLTADIIGEGVQASVPRTVRETVAAVAELKSSVTITRVAKHLGLDKSSASRRVQAAIKSDYLYNDALPGRPADLHKGEEMPEETLVLPTPEQLEVAWLHVTAAPKGPPLPLADDLVE